ncbi:hypothetical protein M2263_004608 [Providencia alcalifaciens]|nr:hypothetical protein [Providencia alcalifaciens]
MPFINDMLTANEKESVIQSLPAQGMERFHFTFDPDAVIQSIKKISSVKMRYYTNYKMYFIA